MQLGEFLEVLSKNPNIMMMYGLCIPTSAILAKIFAKNQGHLPPWNYFYSMLIYLVCIPGIFVLTLNVYLLVFTRTNILDFNVFTQIMPLVVMIITLMIIKSNVSFHHIPGFGKLSGLMMLLTMVMLVLWILDRTHILVLTYMPIGYVFLILIGILLLLRLSLRKVFS